MQIAARVNYLVRLCIDWLLLTVCFFVSFRTIDLSQFFRTDINVLLFVYFSSLLTWYICSRVFHLYTSITIFSYSQEVIIIIRVTLLHLLVIFFLMTLFISQLDYFRESILLYHVFLLGSVIIVKYIYRVIIAFIRNQYKYVRRILIVGIANQGSNYFRSGMLINNLRFLVVGYLADTPITQMAEKYLGSIQSLAEVLTSYSIDEVFLALPNSQVEQINYVVDCCEKNKVQLSVINNFNQLDSATFRVTSYAGFPVVGLRYLPLDDHENRFFKRLFDIIFSSIVLLILLSWLIPILALLIKINSRGPVFLYRNVGV